MTSEESTQPREIKAGEKRVSETRRVQRFVGTAIVKLEGFQEQVHRHQLPHMAEICQFCQAGKWKDETAKSCSRSGKFVLAPLGDPNQDLNQLSEDPLLLVKITSYNNIFALTSIAASLTKNARIDEQLANGREGVYTFRDQGTICHHVGTLLPIESKTPSFAQFHVFDGDMEDQEFRMQRKNCPHFSHSKIKIAT
jgi:hypothetical protein